MAAPAIVSRTLTQDNNTVTSAAVNYPATVDSGDLLLCFYSSKCGDNGVSFPTGWTMFREVLLPNGSKAHLAAAWRKADGTEDGGTFTVTHTASYASRVVAYVLRITGGADPTAAPPVASTGVAVANNQNPDPDTVTPGGTEDYLYIATYGASHGQDGEATAYPSGYTYTQDTESSGGTQTQSTRPAIGIASKQTTNTTSDDPGTFSITSTFAETCAFTVAVSPPVAGSGTLAQPYFRFRSDDSQGLNADAGWAAAINTNVSMDVEKIFRLRIEVEETASVDTTGSFTLQYRKNGGTWTDVSAPGYPTPTAVPAVQFVPSAQYNDGDATTNVLSGSTRTFDAGTGEESNNTASLTLNNEHTEFEFSLLIRRYYQNRQRNDAGAEYEFRLVGTGGSVFTGTYVLPKATVTIPTGLIGGVMVETPWRCGPFRDGNGNLYAIIEYHQVNALMAVVKSTDGGSTWVDMDGANAPTNEDLEAVDAVLENDRLYILHQANTSYWHHVFRVSTHGTNPDTWELIDESVSPAGSATDQQCVSLARRTNGDLVAFFVKNNSPRHEVAYRKKVSGSWDTSDTTVESAGGTHFYGVGVVLGASNKVHIVTSDNSGNVYHRSLDSGNTLSGAETLTSAGASGQPQIPFLAPVYWDDAGSEKVMCAYIKAFSTDGNIYTRVVTNDGTPGTESSAASDNKVARNRAGSGQVSGALVNDGDVAHLIYGDDATNDLWHDENDAEAGWGTDTEEADGITLDQFSAGRFTNGANNVVGYIYDAGGGGNSGFVRYDQIVLPGQAALLQSAISAAGTVAAALTTLITAAASVAASAVQAAALTTSITLAGGVPGAATSAAAITTEITPAASVSATVSTAAALTTEVTMAGSVAASGSTAANVSTEITAISAVDASGSVAGALTTEITPASSVNATASTAAALTTEITAAASVTATASASAAFTIQFNAASSATASVAAALTTEIQAAAAASASGSVAAALTTEITLAGTESGTAATAGALTTEVTAAASASASGTTAAALSTEIAAASAISASATTAASLTTEITGAASVSAAGTVAGALTTEITPAASLAASGAVAADLTTEIAAASAVNATATASGTLAEPILLEATPAASGSVAGALTTEITPAAAASASASTSASLTTESTLNAAVSGTASTSASLTTEILAAGALAASGTTSASLTTEITPAGALTASGTTSASLTTEITAAASISVQGSSPGALTTEITAAASVNATGSVAGELSVGALLQASPTATASVTAALTTEINASAGIVGSASVSPTITTEILAAGAANASGAAAGSITTEITAQAAAAASASVSAALTTEITAASAASAAATTAASLTTEITAAGSLAATGSASAALSTEIAAAGALTASGSASGTLAAEAALLAATPVASGSVAADLTTSITPAGTLAGSATTSGGLSTEITAAGALVANATPAAALATEIAAAGSVSCSATTSGTLAELVVGSASASASVAASLTTEITPAAAASCVSIVNATLNTAITPAASLSASATTSGALTVRRSLGPYISTSVASLTPARTASSLTPGRTVSSLTPTRTVEAINA